MAFAADKTRQGAAGQGGFELDQSLRFNNDDSAYLSKTFAGAGNRKTWTLSFWVKRTGVGGYLFFAHSGNNDTDYGGISLNTNGQIAFNAYNAAVATSTDLYRDPGAWYHYVVAVDTTQATQANRVKFYTNGEQLTMNIGGSYPAQNANMSINAATGHSIGSENPFSNGSFIDDYLAEVHFIDGTQLTPTSFGETGTYGEWKPIEVSGLTYGTNGFYLSFAGGGIMSATGGNSTATDGDYKVASFTSNGTFTPSADGYVEYLIIGGGGGGGQEGGGPGGGAGGYRTGFLEVTGSTAYSITVGAGGTAGSSGSATPGGNGGNSTALGLTSTGGGGGSSYATALAGGSGGGAGGNAARAGGTGNGASGGSANAAGYWGNDGGPGGDGTWYGGGGGGAGAVGGTPSGGGGNGGAGLASSITGSSVTRAGGGGGGTHQSGNTSSGGSGGGGAGGSFSCSDNAVAGTANTGSGGGGAGGQYNVCGVPGKAGGSGIVIIRYKFQ